MPLYLSYDPKKGLIKSNGSEIYGNCISEHDEKGFLSPLHEQTLIIPKHNVKITVRTNLHFGSKSYMNATISMEDKTVLNFQDTSLLHSINIVYAKPGEWNDLFDGIIRVYDNIYGSESSINKYFDAIETAIADIINTNNTLDLHRITSRLAEVSDSLPTSIYTDNLLIVERMQRACGKLFRCIGDTKGWGHVSKRKTIESNLHSIFHYLAERDMILITLTDMRK